MSEYLKHNHTLYGFHMSGNECSIDPMGFMVFDEPEEKT